MDLTQQFEQAVLNSKKLSEKPDNESLLLLYSFYKQATEGDAPESGGYGMFDFVGKAKYDAWLKLVGMTKVDAMNQYIILVENLKQKK